MKFKITFKTPDIDTQIKEAVETELKKSWDEDRWDDEDGFTDDEEDEIQYDVDDIMEDLKKWLTYSEMVSLEFDTESKTLTLVERE